MHTKEKDQHRDSTSLKGIKIRKIPYRISPSVKELERLSNEDARKRNPITPVEWLAPRKYADNKTSGLTRCDYDFLKLKGHLVERTGNEGRVIDNRKTFTDVVGRQRTIGSVTRIKSSGIRGTSDLKSSIYGRFVAIEIKCQSEAQRAYQKQVQQAGGIYVIATSFEVFFAWYNSNF